MTVASSRSATARSSGVVIFRFRGSPSTISDGVPGLLGKRRLVSRVARERQRVAQHRRPERLWRLRQKDLVARQRGDHDAIRIARLTVSCAAMAAIAAPDCAAAATVRRIVWSVTSGRAAS